MSPRDPQHYAVGEPVSGEERSWVDKVYLHFCTAEELARDFSAFEILDLDERSYEEPRASGRRTTTRAGSWRDAGADPVGAGRAGAGSAVLQRGTIL